MMWVRCPKDFRASVTAPAPTPGSAESGRRLELHRFESWASDLGLGLVLLSMGLCKEAVGLTIAKQASNVGRKSQTGQPR